MPFSPDKHFQARIVSRRDITPDLWVIRIAPDPAFRFVAGQYATLGEMSGDKLAERAYSIVSSPYESELEFFFELVHVGELTPHLYNRKPGDLLSCRRIAKGRFTLDLKSGRTNHLLLATVTGIAPFVSYIRTLHADWRKGQMPGDHRLYVVHGASRSGEFAYREELERVAAEVPWLKYVPTVSRPWEDPEWRGELGRVDDVIRKYSDLWALQPEKTSAYLCGHPDMIEHGRGILQRRGWKKDAMSEEVYFIPT
jgi:ferredoxin/flavodoxin---NADP+ reductase